MEKKKEHDEKEPKEHEHDGEEVEGGVVTTTDPIVPDTDPGHTVDPPAPEPGG